MLIFVIFFVLVIHSNNFNMEEIKLSDDVIDQIKDFDHLNLTEEQKIVN